ncbi:GNAT family N-acetyltransferase [Emcibacter nanhaiensis]|uniref:N-acetyltransferase n=1 Tax=Emcibacter nanhaiensis TaxID=1505037 RepID=A0A501PG42_9PROT|nr:N-acetyltransferase [Emcibacter nanhaiensis]TPD59449.1 N-acetyltransferase [Emcibacter nanhaiensis]
MLHITHQQDSDLEDIDALLDECFGSNRQIKTVYKLREGVPSVSELCFVIREDGKLKASLQFWPVMIKSDAGQEWPALLLGPIAVKASKQGQGYGIALMEFGLERAKELGYERVILVGDEPYYRRVGFSRDLALDLFLPGPVDYNRLLARELVPGAMKGVSGIVQPAK